MADSQLRERPGAAIVNQGFEFPPARVTVSGFRGRRPRNSEELAAAVAILVAGEVWGDPDPVATGPLGLDGTFAGAT